MSSFYRPIVIITFQHVNRTFYDSINKMCRIIYYLLDTLVDNVKQAS